MSAFATNQGRAGRRQRSNAAGGFTLVELLVVIGIIGILAAILLPVVSSVRRAARIAATKNQIARIAQACERYYHDFNAYPGPLSNDSIINGTTTTELLGTGGNVTMSENLVLGLLGGPVFNANGAPSYNPAIVYAGRGPQNLNQYNPKIYDPYIDFNKDEVTRQSDNGHFKDYVARLASTPAHEAKDSQVPEFLDSPYGEYSLPILYLRARTGAPGIMATAGKDSISGKTVDLQYDEKQIDAYVSSSIGLTTPYTAHGLVQPGDPSTGIVTQDPSNSSKNFANPYLPYFCQTVGSPNKNLDGTTRQKDGYVLISAGEDRVYGTYDDITTLGNLNQ